MNERLNAYLDGELSAQELTAEERAQAAAFESMVAQTRSAIDQAARPDLEARVMSRIAALETAGRSVAGESLLARWARSLLTMREVRFQLRPVYALGGAFAVAAFLLVSPGRPPADSAGGAAAAARPVGAARVFVQFRLEAAAASTVELAGSFTGWQPTHSLRRSADGVWTVLLPITPGVHDYVFIVDGERWVPDPYAPQVDDGFGGTNSRLTLLTPSAL